MFKFPRLSGTFFLTPLCLLLFHPNSTQAQDTVYARQVIDSLSSPYFKGRGYTGEGAWKASEYIASELKKYNAAPLFGKEYFQPFSFQTTSLSGNPTLSVDGKTLTPAKDFILWPNSPTLKGTYKLFRLKPNNIQDLFYKDIPNSFIVIDTVMQKHPDLKEFTELISYGNPFGAKGILVLSEKPMQVHRSESSRWVHAEVLYSAFPDSASTLKINVLSEPPKKTEVRNVGGIIKGKTDSVIILTAHYDHIGEFGTYYFPGANDNASGVSMVLNFAKYFSNRTPEHTIVFLLVTGEEIGLKGSEYFVSDPPFKLKKVSAVYNFDMVGTGDDGITIVNGNIYKNDFEKLQSINDSKQYLKEIKARGESKGSDHYHFYKNGIKSFFIYTRGGSSAYHNIYDISPALSLSSYSGIMKLLLEFWGE